MRFEAKISILTYFLLIGYFIISYIIYNIIGSIFSTEMFYLYLGSIIFYFIFIFAWAFLNIKIYRSYLNIAIIVSCISIAIININLRSSYENIANILYAYSDKMLNKQSSGLKIITQKNIYNIHNLIVRIYPGYEKELELDDHIFIEKLDAYAGCEVKNKKLFSGYYSVQISC